MPVEFLSEEQAAVYGRFNGPPLQAELERYFFFDDVARELVGWRRGEHNRLGFAVQLGTVRFLVCDCLVKQESEGAFQVSFGCRGKFNDEAHRPRLLRLAPSLDCSLSKTASTGNETPVRWYSCDAAWARS